MNNMNFRSMCTLPSQKVSKAEILLYVIVAYSFGILFRLYLAYDVTQHHPEYFFHGNIIPIWTSDAGLYGYYAKQLILGKTLPYDDVHMLGYILYWIHQLTGLNIDKVVFYAPAILAPAIVIPIILITALYKYAYVGFFSALFAVIGFNYYFRTHLGYTDTDLLIYTLTLFLIYNLIAIIETKHLRFILLGIITIILISYSYHSWKPLVFGLILSYFIYIIIFDRHPYQYYLALLLFTITIVPLLFIQKIFILLVVLLVYFYISKNKISWLTYPYPFYLSLSILFSALLLLGIKKDFYLRVIQYIQKPENFHVIDQAGNSFQFSGMLQDILEARRLPFWDSLDYIAGSPFILFFSILGVFIFIVNHRSALLLLPLLLLGLFSSILGLRFTTFAVPIVFLGTIYFIFLLTSKLNDRKINPYIITIIRYTILSFLMFFTISKTLSYHQVIAPKYTSDQAEALYNLSLRASPNDYIITLWDNGWPLWYASGLKTLTHNGKHGPDSFIISTILTSNNSNLSANMSRYFLEKYNPFYETGSIFNRLRKRQDMKVLLQNLSQPNAKLPKKTFDIYFYLNDQTLLKMPTIKKYANISDQETLSFSFLLKNAYETKNIIKGQHFAVNSKTGILFYNKDQHANISNLIIADGRSYRYQKYPKYAYANLNVIVYKNRYMFVMNNDFVRSFAVRNFLLNKYDKNLFELISVTENSKILKLKR